MYFVIILLWGIQGGDKEGVNAAKHEVKKEKVEDRYYIEIRLKENVDFGDWKKKKTDATEIEVLCFSCIFVYACRCIDLT